MDLQDQVKADDPSDRSEVMCVRWNSGRTGGRLTRARPGQRTRACGCDSRGDGGDMPGHRRW